ncbi:MAG: amino acid adenylation domain-containing protein [Lachnospiraceae bacterium]|nr:amino acid adenylation domain-containing protein [Lachnospiraceae bacterium]
MITSVLTYLDNAAKQYPEKIALVELEKKITYADMAKGAKVIGTNLLDKAGSGRRPIVVLMDKSMEAVISFWGILYSGNIYVPMDANAPMERINKIVDFVQPEAVIIDEGFEDKIDELHVEKEIVFRYETLTEGMADEDELNKIKREIIDTDPAYIICTSGSTGIPKGVVIPHRAIIDFTEEASEVMEFTDQEVFANQAPFYFDASVPDLYCTVRNGATLHILPASMYRFPIQLLEYIKEHEVNAIYWVPSALILVANLRALPEVDVTCLKKIMFCGEVMPVKQLNMWRKYVPDAMYVNYYGPSETTYASTYYIIDREFSQDEALPIGKPALNTGVLVLNDEDKAAGVGEIGELCIKGSGVALGYYNNPEKTAEVFVQNPLNKMYHEIIYRTGDLVKWNERGELEYVCRKDFQIKHQGYRIELGEIEHGAMSISGMKRVCCLYHDKRQQIVLVYEGEADKADVKEVLKTKIPEYMVPEIIHRLDVMPMNANGKIDRVLLKEQYGK